MDLDIGVKLAVYQHFARTALRPSVVDVGHEVGITRAGVREAFARLFKNRVLVLESDGESIRMAPPFSGVPTQHRVRAGGLEYFANCAWDTLGILAALRKPGTVLSSCAQTGEPLQLDVTLNAAPASDWLFHCAVPAAHWWKDIVFT